MSENAVARVYGNPGCPFCERVEKFLLIEGVPTQFIVVGGDPLIGEGIKKLTGQDQVTVPVLVSFLPDFQEIIFGWRENDYVRFADAFSKLRRQRALTVANQAVEPVSAPESEVVAAPPAQRVN